MSSRQISEAIQSKREHELTHEKAVIAVVHTIHAAPSLSANPQTLIPNTPLQTAAITAAATTNTPTLHLSVPLYIHGSASLLWIPWSTGFGVTPRREFGSVHSGLSGSTIRRIGRGQGM
jgi:hypothetical protein